MKSVLVTGAARASGRQAGARPRQPMAGTWRCIATRRSTRQRKSSTDRRHRPQGGDRRGDLAGRDVPERLITKASGSARRPLTCLINNASLFEPDEVGLTITRKLGRASDTNLRAPVFLSQAFARQLPDDQQGNIINHHRPACLETQSQFFSYTTSKSGLVGRHADPGPGAGAAHPGQCHRPRAGAAHGPAWTTRNSPS